jgi:hypothetical protein
MTRRCVTLLLVAFLAPGNIQAFRSRERHQLREIRILLDSSSSPTSPTLLRAAAQTLKGIAKEARGKLETLRVARLQDRTWMALEELGRTSQQADWILEALKGKVERNPDASEPGLQLARFERKNGWTQDALWRLERLWVHGVGTEEERTQVGKELFLTRLQLAEGRAGGHLEAARSLGERLLPRLDRRERAEVEQELSRIATIERNFEQALSYLDASSQVLVLSHAERRQYKVLQRLVAARRGGEVTEAAPSSHFTVLIGERIPFAQAEVYRQVFDLARETVGRSLDFFPEGNLLVQVLVDEDYVRILSPHSLGVRDKEGILLRRPPVQKPSELKATAIHEYAHHALASLSLPGKLPRWFQEGVAQYLESSKVPMAVYRRVLASWRAKALPEIQELEGFQPGDLRRARVLYDTSLLLVAFLIQQAGPGALGRIARGVARGTTFQKVFEEVATRPPGDFLLRWREALLDQIRARLRAEQGESEDPEDLYVGPPVENDQDFLRAPGIWIEESP